MDTGTNIKTLAAQFKMSPKACKEELGAFAKANNWNLKNPGDNQKALEAFEVFKNSQGAYRKIQAAATDAGVSFSETKKSILTATGKEVKDFTSEGEFNEALKAAGIDHNLKGKAFYDDVQKVVANMPPPPPPAPKKPAAAPKKPAAAQPKQPAAAPKAGAGAPPPPPPPPPAPKKPAAAPKKPAAAPKKPAAPQGGDLMGQMHAAAQARLNRRADPDAALAQDAALQAQHRQARDDANRQAIQNAGGVGALMQEIQALRDNPLGGLRPAAAPKQPAAAQPKQPAAAAQPKQPAAAAQGDVDAEVQGGFDEMVEQ